MKKMILAYNFSEERLSGVKRSAIAVKAAVRVVAPESFGEKIGYLAGVPGFEQEGTAPEGSFQDEMLLMSGFDSADIDMMIKSLRKYGVGRVALKAIVTETNTGWSSVELYNAVKADHEEMQRRSSKG